MERVRASEQFIGMIFFIRLDNSIRQVKIIDFCVFRKEKKTHDKFAKLYYGIRAVLQTGSPVGMVEITYHGNFYQSLEDAISEKNGTLFDSVDDTSFWVQKGFSGSFYKDSLRVFYINKKNEVDTARICLCTSYLVNQENDTYKVFRFASDMDNPDEEITKWFKSAESANQEKNRNIPVYFLE